MNLKKKSLIFIIFCISLFLLFTSKTYATTVQDLKNKFPEGRYWNHSTAGVNNPDGTTNRACPVNRNQHDNNGSVYCNEFDGGYQCRGFAYKLFYDYYGEHYSKYEPNAHPWIQHIKPGDILIYTGAGASGGWGHTVWITGVDSQYLYFGECNVDQNCKIMWSRRLAKNSITVKKIIPAPYAINDNRDTTPQTIQHAYVDAENIREDRYLIKVKASDNVGVTRVSVGAWSTANGIDDITWNNASYNSGSGYWEFWVKKSDHRNETDLYQSTVDVYDAAGNKSNSDLLCIPMGSICQELGSFTAIICNKGNPNVVFGIAGTANGSNVILQQKNTSDTSQQWAFEKLNDGSKCYKIKNVKTGRYLDIYNGENNNGTRVIIFDKGNGDNQKFYLMSYNGGYRIVPKHSKDIRGLDVTTSSVGTKVQLRSTEGLKMMRQTLTFEKITQNSTSNNTNNNNNNNNNLPAKGNPIDITPYMFDGDLYYSLYPDLQQAFGYNMAALKNHYITCGIREGRVASYVFNPNYYLNYYEDLKNAFGARGYEAAYHHFINHGIHEGRAASKYFSVNRYRDNNKDLLDYFGNNRSKLLEHFVIFGVNEGRISSSEFNVKTYKNNYQDLRNAFGNDWKTYFKHYVLWGQREGRKCK